MSIFNLDKVLYCGDSLVDNCEHPWQMSWMSMGIDIGSAHWTNIVTKMLDVYSVNTAIGGDTITNISQHVHDRILDYNPSLVIMDGGWNDCMGSDGRAEGFPVLTPTQLKNTLLSTAHQILNQGVQLIYVFCPICYGDNGNGNPMCTAFPSICATVAIELLAEYPNNFFFISLEGTELGTSGLNTRTASEFPYQYRITDGGIHLNLGGNMLFAKNVLMQMYSLDNSLRDRNVGEGWMMEVKNSHWSL